jgi:hypothetical protein
MNGAARTAFSGAGDLVDLVLGLRACIAFDLTGAGEAAPGDVSEPLMAFALGLCSFTRRLEALVLSSSAPLRETRQPAIGELRELLR